ncbi:interferon omega-1-like [Orycteropus afer afer]|uniref:Interferon omega-1-like n=1 Tax=Orycteropus afer afer TaxID=1230840 RepID=A0A8B7ASX6_ORYAF|nr:interferon omega-1-like [Orycteropus afer afer]
MALLLSLLIVLVVFTYGPVPSLGCDLPPNHMVASKKTFVLLAQMRTLSPSFCLDDRKDFRFPQEMVDVSQHHKAQAISVLQEIVQQISNLFHTEGASTAWNMTLLNQFQNALHRQIEDLENCLLQAMGEEESVLAVEGPPLAVKRYFYGLRLYLKEKKHNDCAWEVVRGEIRRIFSSSTNLQERLRRMNGDLGSS